MNLLLIVSSFVLVCGVVNAGDDDWGWYGEYHGDVYSDHDHTFDVYPFYHYWIPTCIRPFDLPNGYIDFSHLFYYYGDSLTLSCRDGYKLVGSASINCGVDGWVEEIPHCKPEEIKKNYCEGINKLENGGVFLLKNRYKIGEEVKFRCKSKQYLLKGNATLKCTENGWNSEQPTCKAHTCETRKCGKTSICALNKNRIPVCVCKSGYRKRTFGKCVAIKTCLEHMSYGTCGSICPPTCDVRVRNCARICAEGCFCDKGYILNGKVCVKISECPCKYNNRTYEENEMKIDDECKSKCKCKQGRFEECEGYECSAGHTCKITEDKTYTCKVKPTTMPTTTPKTQKTTSKSPIKLTPDVPVEPLTVSSTIESPTTTASTTKATTPVVKPSGQAAVKPTPNTDETTTTEHPAFTTVDPASIDGCVRGENNVCMFCRVGFVSADDGKSCKGFCSTLSFQESFYLFVFPSKLGRPFVFEETISFYCKNGTGSEPDGSITCQTNREWSGKPPTCE